MHHLEQKCAHFCSEWGIVGFGDRCIVGFVRLLNCEHIVQYTCVTFSIKCDISLGDAGVAAPYGVRTLRLTKHRKTDFAITRTAN